MKRLRTWPTPSPRSSLSAPFLPRVAIDRAVNRLVATHKQPVVRSRPVTTYLTVVDAPDRLLMRGERVMNIVRRDAPMSFMAGREEVNTMSRRTPTTTKTIFAIGDATMRVRMRLAADGTLCPDDMDALLLLLLDVAGYFASTADIDRRERNAIEDLGTIPARLLREEREVEQEYAHVRELVSAA